MPTTRLRGAPAAACRRTSARPTAAARAAALLAALVGPLAAPGNPLLAQVASAPRADESTIASIHAELRGGRSTCRQVVQRALDRIEALDKRGPAINAFVVLHPGALATADSLDAVQRRGAPLGALHCVPTAVKDNFETRDLQTTAGSLALKGWVPTRDATQVARVRAAGAVIIGKTNLAEWAFSPYETVSSILPGYTKNPYALDRVTAGSSGGTAAAVAADMTVVGLGTDTGNSIRGPSAHQALVGIRSTMGLTSRAGVVSPMVERMPIGRAHV